MHNLTLSELQAAQAAGEITARELVRVYLARIELLDRAGPMLRSVLAVNPAAIVEAAALDAERVARGPRSPLHGLPILLKDNIDTAGGLPTTAGSLALANHFAARDATVTARLRAAGALLLGKANLSEWANFRSTRSTSGWSSAGGQTRNPYALDRSPSGSSSGSAVAVAAGLCAAAIGTETDGSIVSPAAANGLVGLKPTVGLVSRAGIVPIAHSQDTAGPMTRSVRDAAVLLSVLAGPDPADPATAAASQHTPHDYTQDLAATDLRGVRLGVVRGLARTHEQVEPLFEASLDVLQGLGAELVDPVTLKATPELDDAEYLVLLYEFKAGLDAYLAAVGPDVAVHSLAELIAFNETHRAQVMPFFGQDILQLAESKGPLSEPEYLTALETSQRLARGEGIDAALDTHGVHALVAPSGGPAWLVDLVNGNCAGGGCSTLPAVAGYPHITVPMGSVQGLPVGLSLFAGAWQEPLLLRVAYAFEQAALVWRAPEFRGTD